jgi:hypothetical protein
MATLREQAMQLDQLIQENMRGFGNYLLDADLTVYLSLPLKIAGAFEAAWAVAISSIDPPL